MELFKYLNPERADVLQNRRIRFTQAVALNDPFESFPAIIQKDRTWYKRRHEEMIAREMEGIQFKNNVKRKQYLRGRKEDFENFYCCYTDEKWLFEQAQSVIRLDSVIQGYLSLSAVNNNILMWSHYAQNHEGYVLGFDRTHEYFDYGVIKMRYSNQRPFLNPIQTEQNADVFYTKSPDWRYEEEYRKSMPFVDPIEMSNGHTLLPFPDEAPDPGDPALKEVKLFEFPAESVSSVIIGWKSSDKLIESVQGALAKPGFSHVTLARAEPHKFKYEMVVHQWQ